jgi:lipopolysaccharide export system protein LptA
MLGLYLASLTANALSSDNFLPTKISADNAIYDHNLHVSIYRGDVTITQGTTSLQGDEVMIYNQSNNQKVQKLIAIGNPAVYRTLPNHQTQYLYARAKRIEFYPLQHRILLIGDGEITDNKNSFAGARIEYLIDKQTISSATTSQQPETKIVIQPNN